MVEACVCGGGGWACVCVGGGGGGVGGGGDAQSASVCTGAMCCGPWWGVVITRPWARGHVGSGRGVQGPPTFQPWPDLGVGQVRTRHIRGDIIVPYVASCWLVRVYGPVSSPLKRGVPDCAAARALGTYVKHTPLLRVKQRTT